MRALIQSELDLPSILCVAGLLLLIPMFHACWKSCCGPAIGGTARARSA
jgi:hypothetical protein